MDAAGVEEMMSVKSVFQGFGALTADGAQKLVQKVPWKKFQRQYRNCERSTMTECL